MQVRVLGGIGPLIDLLRSPSEDCQANATGALMNCAASDEENRAELRKQHGLSPLINLLSSRSDIVQSRAAGALFNAALDGAQFHCSSASSWR